MSGLLAACGSTTPASDNSGAGGPTGAAGHSARPSVTPRDAGALGGPIASGMQPKTAAPFTIFNYPEYIDPAVIKAFGKKYGVTVKVTPFDDITTGVTKLASGTCRPTSPR